MIGVAASAASTSAVLVAGVAGLVAGSMSMAAGEYVSVSSQYDAEQADIAREKQELAEQLSAYDRLGAHLHDELGLDPASGARPLQAAWISALSFACFGMVPVVTLLLAPAAWRIALLAAVSLVSLTALGALGAYLGGAPLGRASFRVTGGGALAMAVTAAFGRALGVSSTAPQHVHHKHPKGPEGVKEHPEDAKRFFHEVVRSVEKSKEILLVGPSTAKLEFLRYVYKHYHAVIVIVIVSLSVSVNFFQTFRSQRAADRLREAVAPMATGSIATAFSPTSPGSTWCRGT